MWYGWYGMVGGTIPVWWYHHHHTIQSLSTTIGTTIHGHG